MQCQCPLAGYCETHGRQMTARQHGQCASSDEFFVLFARTGPTLKERAKSLGQATRRAGTAAACGKQVLVSAETLAARKAACADCPKEETGSLGLKWCGACGCALAAKQRLATESCPLGRWPTAQSAPTSEP